MTTVVNSAMNQSELEASSCQRLARENARERGTIGFGLASNWLRKLREPALPSNHRAS